MVDDWMEWMMASIHATPFLKKKYDALKCWIAVGIIYYNLFIGLKKFFFIMNKELLANVGCIS